jgi:toxin ParE1/3/4
MKIRWAASAKNDRTQIFDYIEARNPTAAIWMDEMFTVAVSRLRHFPYSGRRGAISGTREIIPHQSYRIIYQIDDQTVSILMIVHTARQWPPAEQ